YDILFGQQDCSSNCLNKTFAHSNLTLDFSCCHNQSLSPTDTFHALPPPLFSPTLSYKCVQTDKRC
ncbi:hypothetical protein U0070_014751, partial [Myodes glareolus]